MPSTEWHSHRGAKAPKQRVCVSCARAGLAATGTRVIHTPNCWEKPALDWQGCKLAASSALSHRKSSGQRLLGVLKAFPPETCSSNPEALSCTKISGELGISILKQPWALAISQAGCSRWSLCNSAGVLCCPDFHLWHFPGPFLPMWKAEGLA